MTNLPSYLLNNDLPDFTDRLGALTGTRAPPYLSIEGDRLTLIDSASEERPVLTRDDKTGDPYLDCCIIDAGDHASQVWYGRAWDPKSADRSPPACWSDNGVAPSINCSTPQALSCTPDPEGKHGCKWACWGSGRAREGSTNVPPACTKYIKLALLIPGEPIQFLLRVPPASHVNLSAYQQKFRGQPIKMRDVLTRVSINDKTLSFKGVGFIDQPTAVARNEVLHAKKTDTLVGRGDVPRTGNPALPTPSQPMQIAAPTASSPASAPVEAERPLSAGNAGSPSTVTGQAQTLTEAPAQVASPSESAPRRRGRPPKADAAALQPVGDPVAPFRQSEPAQQPNGAAPQGQFGMAQAPEPNPELAAALKSMFG